jgi:hypothetical protein
MAIITDIIEGNNATYSSAGWKDLTRTFVVTGVTGSGHSRLYQAMQTIAVAPNYITLGYPHPTITSAQVISINPSAVSSDVVNVSVVYDEIENYPYQYSLGSVASIVETNQALIPGTNTYDDIVLEYTYPDDYPVESFRGIVKKSGCIINKYDPEFSISIRRREYQTLVEERDSPSTPKALTGSILMARNGRYVGKCNKSTWNIFGQSILPRTWICTGISSESVGPAYYSGGWVFDVTYTFNGKNAVDINGYGLKSGYDTLVVFIDPNTGTPPDTATLEFGKSKKVLQIYQEADFNKLELS